MIAALLKLAMVLACTTVIFGEAGIVFGDSSLAAVIAGTFSVVNTVLVGFVLRRAGRTEEAVRQTQEIIAAPRRAVYDHEGDIIGTVLELETERDRVIPPQREGDRRRGKRPPGKRPPAGGHR